MFEKYPTIYHLPTSKMSRDDKRLDDEQVEVLMQTHPLHISEKVDGAVVGIQMQDNTPLLMKRGGIIGTGEHVQFQDFKGWVYGNMERVAQIPEGWIVYGEWLSVLHSVAYDQLPEFFLAFDILTPDGFMGVESRDKYLREFGFMSPQQYEISSYTGSKELIAALQLVGLSHSKYSSTDVLEGFVVRNDFADVPEENRLKAKWVRTSFIQGEHWSRNAVRHNKLKEE